MKILKITLLIFIIILFTCGCNNNNSNNNDIKDKLASEIEYFDSRIVDLLNNLNNISFQNYRLTSKKVQLTEQTENSEASGGETTEKKDREVLGSEGQNSRK